MGRLQPLCLKTKSCKYHAAGRCKKGSACTFAHGVGELLPRPPVLQNKNSKQEQQQPAPGQSGAEPLGLPASPSGTLAGHSTIPHGLNMEAPPSLAAPGVQVVPGAPGIFGVGQLHPPPPGPCPAVSSGLGPAGLPPPLGSSARPQASGAGEQQRSLGGLGLGLGLGLVPVAEASGDGQMAVPTNNGSVSDEGSEGPLTDDDEHLDERATGDGDLNKGRTRLNKFHKTQLCMFHQMGKCKKRTSCRFAHGPDELRPVPDLYRTKLCPTMLEMGQCSDGECRFAHSAEELRNFEAQDLAAAELAAGRPFLAPGGPAQAMEPGQVGPEAHSRQAAMPPSQAPPPVSCTCGPCNVGMACGGAAWPPPGSSAVSEAPLPSLRQGAGTPTLGSEGLCPPLGVMSSKLCPALLSLGRCVAGPSCIFAHNIDQVRPIPAPQAAMKRPNPAMQVPGGCGGPAPALSPQVLQAFAQGRALHNDFASFSSGKSDQASCNAFSRANLGEGNQLARLGDESDSLPQAPQLEPKVPRLRVKNTFLTVQESSAAASWPRSRTLPVPSVPEESFGRLPVHVYPTASCAGNPSLGQPEAREPSGQRMADGHLLEDGMLSFQRQLDKWPFQSATRVPASTAPSNCHPTAAAGTPDIAASLLPDAAPAEPRVPRLRVKNTFLTVQDSSDASQPPRSRTLPIPSIFENGEGPEAGNLDGQRPSSTSPVNIDTSAQRLMQTGFADHAQAGLDIARVPLPHRQGELSEFLPGCGHRNLRVSSEHLGAGPAAWGGNRASSTSDAAAAAGLAPSLSQSRLPSSAVLPGRGPLEQAFPGSIGSGCLDSFHRTDANRRLTEALCPEPPLLKSDRSFLGHAQDLDLDLWALRQQHAQQLDHSGPIGSSVVGTAAGPMDAAEQQPFETPAAPEPRVPRLRVKNTFLTVQDSSAHERSTLPPRSRTLPIPSIFEAERASDLSLSLSKGIASLPVRPPRSPEDQGLQESETLQGSLRPGTGNAASEKLLQDLPLELDRLHGDCGLPSYLTSDLMVLPHQDQFAELDGWPLSPNLSKEQWEAQADAVAGPLTAPGTLSGVGGGQEGEAELAADQLGRERRVPRLRVKNTFLTVQESAVEMQPRSRTLPVSSIFESEESSQGELERRPASVSGHLELQSTGEDGQPLLESQAPCPWGGLERLNHFALPGSGGDRSSSSLASSRLEGLEMEGVEGEASDGGLGQADARLLEDDLSPSQETTVRRLRVKNTFLTVDDPAKEALVPRSRTLPVPQQGETAGPPGEAQVPPNGLDPGSAVAPGPSTSSTSGLTTEGSGNLQFGRAARVLTKKRSLLPKIGEGDQGTGCSDAQDL